jgi:hypothetical protein
MRVVAAAATVVVAACSSGDTPANPMPKPIAAIEHRIGTPFRGVAIARDGIYYERKKVATLADFDGKVRGDLIATLMHARGAAGPPTPPGVLDPQGIAMGVVVVPDPMVSAELVGTVLAVVVRGGWHNISLKRVHSDPDDPNQHDLAPVCNLVRAQSEPRRYADPDSERVTLSVLITTERSWIGLSRVNEFYEVPNLAGNARDLEKLERTLAEHKASAFFADRSDVEVALEGPLAVDVLLDAIHLACKVGFTDVEVVPPADLAARPML